MTVDTVRRSQGRRRHRHHQGPRHRRRHEAAQLHGQRATHGVKKVHRHIGGTIGKHVPRPHVQGQADGRPYGNERSTMRNLKLVRVDAENNLLLVHGAVPGPNGGYVIIHKRTSCKSCKAQRMRLKQSWPSLTVYNRSGQRSRQVRDRADRSGAAHQQAIAARRGGDVPGEPAAGHVRQDQEPRRSRRHRPRRCIARRGRATPGPARGAAVFAVAAVTFSPSGRAISDYRLPRKAVQLATRMALAVEDSRRADHADRRTEVRRSEDQGHGRASSRR